MKLRAFRRFNIALKIGTGYLLIFAMASLGGIGLFYVLQKGQNIDEMVTEAYFPYFNKVRTLQYTLERNEQLINSWVYNPNVYDQNELKVMHDRVLPQIISDLDTLFRVRASFELSDSLTYQIQLLQQNMQAQQTIMQLLEDAEAYDDADKLYTAIPLLDDEVIPQMRIIRQGVGYLLVNLETETDHLLRQKVDMTRFLRRILIVLLGLGLLFNIVYYWYSIRSIVRPINQLSRWIEKVSNGNLEKIEVKSSEDEIGDMKIQIVKLVSNLQEKSKFAQQIGQGEINATFVPLSENDTLGHSLLAMRDNLKSVVAETNEVVTRAGQEGELSIRVSETDKSGAWKQLSGSINFLLNSISLPLSEVKRIALAMADGNLTLRYHADARGEVKQLTDSLNHALDNLNHLLAEISQSAQVVEESSSEMLVTGEEMRSSTHEISTAISQMSSGAQTQVVKVDESFKLVEGVLNRAGEVREKSEAINGAALRGVENSKSGVQMINQMVNSMHVIQQTSDQTSHYMKILTERSAQISSVLSVISEIAAQTNLLSLNAAIEAAQAGDAGRGFAVVAEEIRRLAEDSRRSAREIESLIVDVQKDTEAAALMMDTMTTKVSETVGVTQSASAAFHEISRVSQETLAFSEDILHYAKNQSDNIKHVVGITESVVVIAEQTAAGTEEVATSTMELSAGMESYLVRSHKLSDIANNLKVGVKRFRLS